MINTKRTDVSLPLSPTQIKTQRSSVKAMLDGFCTFAVLRAKQFRDLDLITRQRYIEFLKYFGDIKEQIAAEKVETTAELYRQNEHLDCYAFVAANFVPDAKMWTKLLDDFVDHAAGAGNLLGVIGRSSNPVHDGTEGEGRR